MGWLVTVMVCLRIKVKFFITVCFSTDDEHLPPLSTIEQRSLAILQELPFLIGFNTRVLLLRDWCRNSLGENDFQRLHSEFLGDNLVVIRRTHLYEDAFEKLSVKNGNKWFITYFYLTPELFLFEIKYFMALVFYNIFFRN